MEHLLSSLELCAGAGGQALGLERAGFSHEALIEIDGDACNTLRMNRPNWSVLQEDLMSFSGKPYDGVDLLAAGLPCPPFSVAGQQLGEHDERNLFPTFFRIVDEVRPRAAMIENVKGIMGPKFEEYRRWTHDALSRRGYWSQWSLFEASQFGVSQFRQRAVLVAFRDGAERAFSWPMPSLTLPTTVGDLLFDLITENRWKGAGRWRKGAASIAPTIVGGSKKHGGPDLGPTRAREAWRKLGVNGAGLADKAPEKDFLGLPKLTNRMVARIQGFPDEWLFFGGKTTVHRQVGNAFPPAVAEAVGRQICEALVATSASLSRVG
jgi:DNA (cytosine-5)-methyltransferase 1